MQNIEQGTSNFENEERIGIDDEVCLLINGWQHHPLGMGMVDATAEGVNHFE